MSATVTLELECFPDDLSPIQLEQYEKAEKEHNEIRSKLNDIMRGSSSENIFSGNIFSAYQLTGLVTGLESYAKAPSAIRTQNRKIVKNLKTRVQTISDDDQDDDVEEIPLSKRVAPARSAPPPPPAASSNKRSALQARLPDLPKAPSMKAVKSAKPIQPPSGSGFQKPAESNSFGGLMIGAKTTPDAPGSSSAGTPGKDRSVVDSQEVNFSKLQGKTYPSLVVFVRPTLLPKDNTPNDRPTLDGRVKTVLMHTPAKFTEWLIQQGLIRSEMECQLHPGKALKLGMYSEVNRFPYSGGYVWISECCKQKFTSVFNGSIFESATQTPSVLLKLIYHWSCQTNVQNVVQWVKVNNLFIKQFYAHLRSLCTVALYNHFGLLGGPGKRIEVGVISLGTSSADGAQRQVKVEVLGIYDPLSKKIRLRAVEPLPYSDKVYRKRFLKILEPLVDWVHEDTVILTDLTVDKLTLHNYGFRNVIQSNPAEVANSPRAIANSNVTIMDYLRRVVPRMFQNTLSLLNRSMIQQFLDELVWREIFGTTPNTCYDNMLRHISEQTRVNQRDRLLARLTKVYSNPFRNWKLVSGKAATTATASTAATTSAKAHSSPKVTAPPPVQSPQATKKSFSGALQAAATHSHTSKRKRSPPPPPPKATAKAVAPKRPLPPPAAPQPPAKRMYQKKAAAEPVDNVSLEGFYYGIHVPRESEQDQRKDSCEDVVFEVKCPDCELTFVTNLELQDHLFDHVSVAPKGTSGKYQCRYCFERYREHDQLMRHIIDAHPIEVNRHGVYYDLICEQKFPNVSKLATHMLRSHYPSELPYRCGCCTFACSSRRMTIDHFYEEHGRSATLLCPICMQIFVCANRQDGALQQNVTAFLEHLREHREPKGQKQCSRCRLTFSKMGQLRVHLFLDHGSGYGQTSQLQAISKTNMNIPRPKTKVPPAGVETFLRIVEAIPPGLVLDVPNGRMCLECGQDFDTTNHIIGRVQCPVCHWQTYCLPTALEHTHRCSLLPPKVALEQEFFCVCEFSTTDAIALTRHMIVCERRSAYPSVEMAKENVLAEGVLDGLGLMRTGDGEESMGGDESGVVEQQQVEEEQDVVIEQGGEEQPQIEEGEEEVIEGGDEITETFMTPEEYNSNMSLVDLAPTPSVIVQHMPEVVADYQDLQTPQAPDSHLMGYGHDGMAQEDVQVMQTDVYGESQHHFQGY